MNKVLLSLHWCIHMLLALVLYFIQQSIFQYDFDKAITISMAVYTCSLIVFTFMIIKNPEAWSLHTVILIFNICFTFKVFQLPLASLWLSFLVAILYGLQLFALSNDTYKGWGIWTYFLIVWVILPVYNLIGFFVNKPVITAVFDNNFSSLNGLNPLFTGLGYISASLHHTKNYLGMGPMMVMTLLTLAVSLPVIYRSVQSRKDGNNEIISE